MSDYGRSLAVWVQQLFCSHASRTWTTVTMEDGISRTTGGCDNCGKWISPTDNRCRG